MLPENAITYDHSWDPIKYIVAIYIPFLYLASEGIDTVFKIHLFFCNLDARKTAPARFTTNTPAFDSIL